MSRPARWAVVAALSMGLASCAVPTPGRPVSAAPPGTDPAASAPAGSAGGIDVTVGFDPCAAVGRGEVPDLRVEDAAPGRDPDGSITCTWARFRPEPSETYLLAGVVTPEAGSFDAREDRFPVGRYSAVVGTLEGATFDSTCFVLVAVRPDQMLRAGYVRRGEEITDDAACAKARAFAEVAVANLERG